MLKEGSGGELVIISIWVLITFVFWALGTIMRNSGDGHQQKNSGSSSSSSKNGLIPSSFRAVSSYFRIVSSGASTVARSAASVAQSIVDKDDASNLDQVLWAGFDKLESENDVSRKVLLLGYHSGFQVWDVEETDNVFDLVSRYEGPVSFLQMLPKPVRSKQCEDKFAEHRPLLSLSASGAVSDLSQDKITTPRNGSIPSYYDSMNDSFAPNVVRFYSLKSQSYVHVIKFRSVVYAIRCSSRVVAISQPNQIHCFNSATLEMEYTLITNPIMTSPNARGIGYGPLAVGPRWLAYSGSPVIVNGTGRVSPQQLTNSASFSGFTSNGSLVVHYAKESSKQLAAGIVTLGDMGYKKLSRYYSELLPDSHNSVQSANPVWKGNGSLNGHLPDADSIGMVVVRDIVSKVVISQFRAHRSPISALCFDPSGTLLVTASVQGHNINIFKIMPGSSSGDSPASHLHLYRLQRGFTNAVIQDISFSDDNNYIMISSSKGTSHLFAINPMGGSGVFLISDTGGTSNTAGPGVITKPAGFCPPNTGSQMHNQHCICPSGLPITLSVVCRIRNSGNGWRGTVTGAAATATGKLSCLQGAIASSFHNNKAVSYSHINGTSLRTKYQLLVFCPSGSMIQYALRVSSEELSTPLAYLSTTYELPLESDGRLIVEPIQKWNICHKQCRREREDNIDIYGENGYSDSNKIYPAGMNDGNITHPRWLNGVSQANLNPLEKHHMYISEAELQMHQARNPLWAKLEISFQPMLTERVTMDEENTMQGEIEIERIPSRTIEARSKDLVPVYDYLQTPKFQYARVPTADCNCNGGLQQQRPMLFENGKLSSRSSSGSLDLMFDGGGVVAELQNGVQEVSLNSSKHMPRGTLGSLNINDSPKIDAWLATVNNRESSSTEAAQVKFVNNRGSKIENRIGDEGNEFD